MTEFMNVMHNAEGYAKFYNYEGKSCFEPKMGMMMQMWFDMMSSGVSQRMNESTVRGHAICELKRETYRNEEKPRYSDVGVNTDGETYSSTRTGNDMMIEYLMKRMDAYEDRIFRLMDAQKGMIDMSLISDFFLKILNTMSSDHRDQMKAQQEIFNAQSTMQMSELQQAMAFMAKAMELLQKSSGITNNINAPDAKVSNATGDHANPATHQTTGNAKSTPSTYQTTDNATSTQHVKHTSKHTSKSPRQQSSKNPQVFNCKSQRSHRNISDVDATETSISSFDTDTISESNHSSIHYLKRPKHSTKVKSTSKYSKSRNGKVCIRDDTVLNSRVDYIFDNYADQEVFSCDEDSIHNTRLFKMTGYDTLNHIYNTGEKAHITHLTLDFKEHVNRLAKIITNKDSNPNCSEYELIYDQYYGSNNKRCNYMAYIMSRKDGDGRFPHPMTYDEYIYNVVETVCRYLIDAADGKLALHHFENDHNIEHYNRRIAKQPVNVDDHDYNSASSDAEK